MTFLVLDVDRGGDGHWTNELHRRYGIDRPALRDAFFAPYWGDIVTGRRPIEPALADAFDAIGAAASVDDVVACWFEADFVPVPRAIELARRAASAGVVVAAGTNQESRRATHLREHLGTLFPLTQLIASADVGWPKPEPEFFLAADRRLGREPGTSVVFADDGPANVEVARAHGWSAVHVGEGPDWITEVEALLGLEA